MVFWIVIALIVYWLIRAGEKQLKLEMIEREMQARRELEMLSQQQVFYQPPQNVDFTNVRSEPNRTKQPVLLIEGKRVK